MKKKGWKLQKEKDSQRKRTEKEKKEKRDTESKENEVKAAATDFEARREIRTFCQDDEHFQKRSKDILV